MNGQTESAPSLGRAMSRVVEAGHRLILDRIDLAVLQARELRDHVTETALLVAAGAGALALAWIGISCGFAVLIARALPASAAIFIVAGVNLALGALLLVVAGRRRSALARAGGDGARRQES